MEKMAWMLLRRSKVIDTLFLFAHFSKLPLVASKVSVEPVMFCLGPETSKIICEKEGINISNFAA
jgi:hypothetical protein